MEDLICLLATVRTLKTYNEFLIMKANGDVDGIKESKVFDWWHPACYMYI